MTAHSFLMMLVVCAGTVVAFLIGRAVQQKAKWPVANPVLIAIVLVGVAMRLMQMDYATYFRAAQPIHLLLGPATVALAVPMVLSLEHMRRGFLPMLCALLAGAVAGAVSGFELVRWFGGSDDVALSMLPKSLTTPIAIGVSAKVGGVPALTAVLAIAGGILVAVCIDPVLQLLRMESPMAKGLAAGTAGSGIGASRVIPQHAVTAAFAGIGIGLNGLITAVIAPVIVKWLR